MKSINLFRRFTISKQFLFNRNYITPTSSRLQNDEASFETQIGKILESKKLETPPITSVPGIYRCSVNNPLQHEAHHIGKFYKIEDNEADILDPTTELFEKQYLAQCKAFHEKCLMIRQPAIEVISYLKRLNLSQPLYKFILFGDQEGVGKRSTVLHVMHYCLKDNWLLLTIPHASGTIRHTREELEASNYKEGRVDTPVSAVKFLKRFSTQNINLLKNINLKTSKDYTWSTREKTAAGTSIIDLIEFGKERAKYSSDICGVLIKEIKLQSKEKNLKVLVTIDELNCFYGPTRLKKKDKSEIALDSITLYRNYKKLVKSDWTNAVLLGTVNSKGVIIPAPKKNKKNYDTTIQPAQMRRIETTLHYEGPLTPAHLLKREGFYDLEPFITVEVPKYSVTEATNCFEYFKDRNWIQNPLARDDEGREEFIFLSGRNPAEFMRVCSMI